MSAVRKDFMNAGITVELSSSFESLVESLDDETVVLSKHEAACLLETWNDAFLTECSIDLVRRWAVVWCRLATWGKPLTPTFKVEAWHVTYPVLGRAHPKTNLVEIYVTGGIAEDLSTVLHELAHIASPAPPHHGIKWKIIYVRAVAEVCQRDVASFDLEGDAATLDDQCRRAIELWLSTEADRLDSGEALR
jgi:hypothetical protein